MKCTAAEELSDSDDWGGPFDVRASRVLGQQVPDLTKKRRLVKASASAHDVGAAAAHSRQEQPSRTATRPPIESFAYQPPQGSVKPAFSALTNPSPNNRKEENGACFVKDSPAPPIRRLIVKFSGKPPPKDQAGDEKQQNGKPARVVDSSRDTVQALEASNRKQRGPVNGASYGQLDDTRGAKRPVQSSVERAEAPSSLRGRRKRKSSRIVDDSSDEEYDYRAEKRGKQSSVTYHQGPDMDHDCANDEEIARQLQEDEEAAGTSDSSQGTGRKSVLNESGNELLKKTLHKCEQIATGLRKQLKRNSSTAGAVATDRYAEVDASAAKVVTQEDVWAACSIEPSSSDRSLTGYQLVGVNFLLLLHRQKIGGAILADEMGLGKTVQAVVYLAVLRQLDQDFGPHLVVCPASLLENWQRELNRWCPSFSVLMYHGNERIARCKELLALAKSGAKPPFDVMLTCYSLFERESEQQRYDRKLMKSWKWSCVLMDEAHLLKDRDSLRTRHLRSVAQGAHHRLMLTGTPLQNDLQELWSLLEFMMPKTFDTGGVDLSKLLGNRKATGHETVQNMGLISQIKLILGPFVLRRLKSDVMQQLVPKIQKLEVLEMLRGQEAAYKEAVDNYRKIVAARAAKSSKTGLGNLVSALPRREVTSIFTELRKLANHPLLSRRIFNDQAIKSMSSKFHQLGVFGTECTVQRVREELSTYSDFALHKMCVTYGDGDNYGQLDEKHAVSSAKCQAMARLLPELQKAGHRPLIFSQWTGMLDILEWALDIMGFKYVRLDGSTPVTVRQGLVDSFNSSTDIFAFLLSTRAGGQGLNLTGADTVILHDVDFNPQVDRQAEDRCHRIGQTKPVTVYRLVTKGTVDENIFKIAKQKLVLDAAVLESKAGEEPEKNCQENIRNISDILSSIFQVASPS